MKNTKDFGLAYNRPNSEYVDRDSNVITAPSIRQRHLPKSDIGFPVFRFLVMNLFQLNIERKIS